MRTEKSRPRRALMLLREQMRVMRHSPLPEQVDHLNQMLRGHDAYYGIAGNLRSLLKVHRAVERYWRKILSSRSWHGAVPWEQFHRIKSQFPLRNRSSTSLTRSCRPSPNCESTSDEPSAGNPHATFCGSRRRVTASGHPVAHRDMRSYRDPLSPGSFPGTATQWHSGVAGGGELRVPPQGLSLVHMPR
jgi:hypothetical protein